MIFSDRDEAPIALDLHPDWPGLVGPGATSL